MPGRLFLTTPADGLARQLGLPQLSEEPPRLNIAPGQELLTLTPNGALHMRWGIVPVGRVNARGRPVMETIVNARGETVFDKSAFQGTGRAIVPVDGWYEWTGEKRRKTAWRISRKDGSLIFFAAISDVWKAPGGLEVPQVAIVTCPPNAEVAEIHDRMGVILSKDEIEPWLTCDDAAARSLIRPLREGQLDIRPASDIDWSAP